MKRLDPGSEFRCSYGPSCDVGASAGARMRPVCRWDSGTRLFGTLKLRRSSGCWWGHTPATVDGTERHEIPGVLIFMQPGSPSSESGNRICGGSPGFHHEKRGGVSGRRLKTAGLKIDSIEGRGPDSGYITTPDGLRIEMQGNDNDVSKRSLPAFSGKDLDGPIASDHLHYFCRNRPSKKLSVVREAFWAETAAGKKTAARPQPATFQAFA